MTQDQIEHIVETKSVPHPTEDIKLKETHISWVILTDDYVYKIKKPVKFDFVDFSTLEKRKYYCEQEVKLNRRLAPSMYLGVGPIKKMDEQIHFMGEKGTVVDYTVLMKRLDETKQLDLLLDQENVETEAINKLADTVASFHKEATVVREGVDWEKLYQEFEDTLSVKEFFVRNFGKKTGKFLEILNQQAHQFLNAEKERIDERNKNGFVLDGHGDLHARNIFLLEAPVIFDCIEFNDDLRKLDQLNEIAFLCMDLERFGRFDLSQAFHNRYLSKMDCIENKMDERLFLFYKLYRASVRMKVNAIGANANENEERLIEEVNLIRQYLELCKMYSEDLKG